MTEVAPATVAALAWLRLALEELERAGLVTIQTDVALFGSPTPPTEHLYVRLTADGQRPPAALPPETNRP